MSRQKFSLKRNIVLAGVVLLAGASTVIAADATTTKTEENAAATTTDAEPTTATEASTTETSKAATTAVTTVTSDSDASTTSDNKATSTASATPATSGTDSPSVGVPDTSNAPFMHQSKVPEGTVFIAVGAIIGAFFVTVLVWRSIVACLLHRSVKKAAIAQHVANDKAGFLPPSSVPQNYPNYSNYPEREPSSVPGIAMNPIDPVNAPTTRATKRSSRMGIASPSAPSAPPSSLFFSPTAPSANPAGAGNRSSTFLPAGYYGGGGQNPNSSSLGQYQSVSATTLRPESRDNGASSSGPDSPAMMPNQLHHGQHRQNYSTSSVNLGPPMSGRAPSTFLDDLMDTPGGHGHGHHHNHRHSHH